MTGPVILVVRLLTLLELIICFVLVSRGPFEAIVITSALTCAVLAMWVNAEKQRAEYIRKFQREKAKEIEKQIIEHHYVKKSNVPKYL